MMVLTSVQKKRQDGFYLGFALMHSSLAQKYPARPEHLTPPLAPLPGHCF
jgi:hypothetical protein